MSRRLIEGWRVLVLLMVASGALAATDAAYANDHGDGGWTSEFGVKKSDLVSVGRNPYFVLEPGYRLILEQGRNRLVITVLNDTRVVDGVRTRVVEERETEAGQLVEVSRNFYAISKRTNSVFYFGEEVDVYKNGKIAGHEGEWASGVHGAKFGLMMPGEALLGARHAQELAPGKAMDRARIVSTTATLTTPAGVFRHCLKVEETTPLEPGVRELKLYARGVGLIQDGSMKLVKAGMVKNVR